ncbi:MAG: gamma carbonic anhydrase family protein [Halobacteriovoraceae bacterium]|nr:gamma carbonic anhydrase family protein [Halobacteriovoraceae bacterium]
MSILKYLTYSPKIGSKVFIAEGAKVIGRCFIGDNTSIWFNSVLRGDVAEIRVGKNTNIQDNSTLHITEDIDLVVGNSVTVGHGVTLHSCNISDFCLIGMGSVVLDNVKIGEFSLVAAGSVLPPNKVYGTRKLIRGNPAREVRDLTQREVDALKESALHYMERKDEYLS